MERGIIACINGKLVPKEEAKVSSFDFGFLYGVGLFETFRTWRGRLVGLERHLSRLMKDATNLGWQLPPTLETLTDWVLRTLKANKSLIAEGKDVRVRITVTPGTVDPAKGWWDFASAEPTVVIHVTPLPPDFDSRNERGWTAVLAPWRRPKDFPLWQIKATTYFANVLARRHARSKGADEALWLNTDGNLTEGTATNLFVICDGEIWTPPPEEGLLPGVARSLVIELAASLGFSVIERPIPLSTLSRAEEAFLTNAVIGLVPLTKIGDTLLPSTQTSLQLRSAFFDHCFKRGQVILWRL
ncbi:aminotransferase class IV [Fervidibacter sacchari]|uniref:Branched-subunit amino acid aminotransferase/4-amino-4-deoxychorismate lyase n=1 Tax=Candidatus Fervidibacter sacchari TaxID=1448929 RepID=A0ABT2EJH2_9BACT|nr:aminotransferase class IV [Candidatus Fervidibacter sacchari]MCS3918091.1 branched-subunit amino acid aminotransferase/4-amino-4-deoxychorismate lyase [Candidatus Fervidibacter sacchari]WKU15898.1 aminotransferase class IV [Candidatus Fervidibacter sacchari]